MATDNIEKLPLAQQMDLLARLETVQEQLVIQLEQLEAYPKAVRDWIQHLSDSREIQAHATDIVITTKDFMYRNIFRFQLVRLYVDAFSCYANLVFIARRYLPRKLFEKHIERLTHYKEEYWLLCDSFGPQPHSRALNVEMFMDFYEVFDYLLNTRILTREEFQKAYESFVEARDEAYKEFFGENDI